MTDRKDILVYNAARKAARGKLIGGAKQTRENLRPGNLAQRWKSRQVAKLENAKDKTLQVAGQNKGLLGGLLVGAILVAAHKPLIAAAGRLGRKIRK